MTYTTGNLIEASDYNTIMLNGTNKFNTVWGTGSGDAGYGQTAVSTVAVGATVTATQWSTLLTRINSARAHQGGAAFGMTSPTAGNTISVISNLVTNIDTLYTNRLSAAAVAAGVTTNTSGTGTWTTATTHTITVTFSSADGARYFFNCGGYIEIDPAISGYSARAKNRSWDALIQMFGQLRISAQTASMQNQTTSATVTEAHTSNNAAAAAIGYYDLTTTNQLVVTKTLTTSGSPYLSPSANNITVNVRSNGVQGSNGDTGTILTITVAYNDAAADTSPSSLDVVDGTLTTATVVYAPVTTNLTQSWVVPTVSGTNSQA